MGESKEEFPRRISRNLQYQKISELAPKGSNSEVPAGQFQRRSELAPKGINSEVLVGEFRPNKVWNSNLGFKFWARGRVFQDLKRRISLCTAHFSSKPTKWKSDGRYYNFKFKFTKQVIYVDKMISTNALSVFIFHHHLNRLGNKNIRSIQEIMRANEPADEEYTKVCGDLPNITILTKSATPGKV